MDPGRMPEALMIFLGATALYKAVPKGVVKATPKAVLTLLTKLAPFLLFVLVR